ncbi:MAG: hypothetical protein LRY71_11740, partial [Bacillaceae bacterium]|nr:hypothetical protein [Bacillaceae bacterium]
FAFRSSAHFLTANALPVSYTLPPLRRVRDFHPLVRCAAKRTIRHLLSEETGVLLVLKYMNQRS